MLFPQIPDIDWYTIEGEFDSTDLMNVINDYFIRHNVTWVSKCFPFGESIFTMITITKTSDKFTYTTTYRINNKLQKRTASCRVHDKTWLISRYAFPVIDLCHKIAVDHKLASYDSNGRIRLIY